MIAFATTWNHRIKFPMSKDLASFHLMMSLCDRVVNLKFPTGFFCLATFSFLVKHLHCNIEFSFIEPFINCLKTNFIFCLCVGNLFGRPGCIKLLFNNCSYLLIEFTFRYRVLTLYLIVLLCFLCLILGFILKTIQLTSNAEMVSTKKICDFSR